MSNKFIHSKEINIIFKMTVFCDEEEPTHLKFPMNEVTKSHKNNTKVFE